ncbi:MAG: aldehyde dehydrogenase family protein [Flavobacteriales bacterium]|nr:aldehyde dehydrogenase family protein [Flavobacteriales bacterium]
MENLTENRLNSILEKQRSYFASHETKNIDFRISQLKKLKAVIQKYQAEITKALHADLRKSEQEAYLTEISIVNQEIEYHLSNIREWSQLKKVQTPIHLLPSKSRIQYEPLGIALIIAPWNYPFQLLFNPLVGAISAGCTTVLKPSPYTPSIAALMDKMIKEIFDEKYVAIVQGGKEENELLLKKRFDIIFFTGSPMLGKVVMRAAAEHLTPVILELGGKSPCIVDESANIAIAAKRIAWSKTINAGQTCIAPDYLMVHESVKDELLAKIEEEFVKMFGADSQKSEFYPRIVNDKALERLKKLMQHGTIRFGGKIDEADKFISPTIIDNVKEDYPIMQEEIFGPLLPVLTFKNIQESIDFVNKNEKPLALYVYSNSKIANEVLFKTSSGGACVNDGLMHIANHHLPFGGVGNSGMGGYHGHKSFLAFSNEKAFVNSSTLIDLPFKYVPFKYFNWIKKII